MVPGTSRTIDQLWRPDMSAAIAYAHCRVGDIAFAVRTQDRFYGYRPDHDEWSASVVKAMLLVTYLDSAPVRDRALTARDTAVLGPMIRISDNDDAQIIFDTVGQAGLSALARRVGMTHFATNPVWGETQHHPARPDPLLPAHRRLRGGPPPVLRHAPAAQHLPGGPLGDRGAAAPGLEAVLQGRLGLRHRPARTTRSCSSPAGARASRSRC